MGELDAASYRLSADALECIAGDQRAKRYGAFVELAICWAKRSGATESRDVLTKQFRDYSVEDMQHALRMDESRAEEPDPTKSGDESNEPSSPGSSDDSPTN
jgi:hypothetical protein